MRALSWVLGLSAICLVVAARVHTFHLTEGEALVAAWPAWLAALVLGLAAVKAAKP